MRCMAPYASGAVVLEVSSVAKAPSKLAEDRHAWAQRACRHICEMLPDATPPTREPHPPPLAQVASLPTKQRLLQSMIAVWPRRAESQLGLTTPRTGLLQRACSTVEEWQAAAERSSRSGSVADVLWHGIKVAFEEVSS